MKGGIDFNPYLDLGYEKKNEGLRKGNECFLSHQSIPKKGWVMIHYGVKLQK